MKTIIKLGGLVVLLSFMVFCQVCFADEGEKALKKEGAEYIPARPAEQLKALEGIKENIIEQKQSFEEDLPVTTIPVPVEEKLPYDSEIFRKEEPILYEEKKIDPAEMEKKLEYPGGKRIRPPEEFPMPKEPELTIRPFYFTPSYILRPVREPVFLRSYRNPIFGSTTTLKIETIISYIGDEEEEENGISYSIQ